jgi:hypothetical protein
VIPSLLLVLALMPVRADTGRTPPAAVEAPLPSGLYALEIVLATRSRVPVLGDTAGSTNSTVLVEIEAVDSRRAVQRHTTCAVSVHSERGIGKVVVPSAFIAAHPVRPLQAQFQPAADAVAYTLDLGEEHVGWNPAGSSEIPRTPEDPRVIDWEGDGHPGGTILLQNIPVFQSVEIYVVQSAHLRLQGRVEGGEVRGSLEVVRLEQRTLGASVAIFGASLAVRADLARSRFRMVPVPAGTRCDTIGGWL